MAKSTKIPESVPGSGDTIPFKNVDLEVLRCAAILLTLVVHLPELFLWRTDINWTRYFWFYGGVDLFFVISGYIITTSLLNSLKKKEESVVILKSFWIKRMFRILPMAYLWTLVPIILAFTFNQNGIFVNGVNLVRDGVANVTQTANFHAQECSNPIKQQYCGIGTYGQNPFGPYWSLSVEEQFYIVFPLLLLFMNRRYLTVLLALIPLFMLFVDRRQHGFFILRFDAIAVGVLLAFAQARSWYKELYPNLLEKYGGGVLLLIACCLLIGLTAGMSLIPFTQSVIVALCGLLVFVASYDKNLFTRPFARFRPFFLWGGDRSYAIYLIHVPAFLLANAIYLRVRGSWDGDAKYFVPVLGFLLLFLLTEISVRLVEHPLRRYGRVLAKQIERAPQKRSRGRPRKVQTAA
jgi:peptidoglycan/LPS O-acetylase OafA/YrhL